MFFKSKTTESIFPDAGFKSTPNDRRTQNPGYSSDEVKPEEARSILGTNRVVTIKSRDGKRSVVVDAKRVTAAYSCANEILSANPDLGGYSGLRTLMGRAQAYRTAVRFERHDGYGYDTTEKFNLLSSIRIAQAPLLQELLDNAQDGSDELIVLDLLFAQKEGHC